MNELDYLRDLVVIMGLGVVIVAVFHRFKIPTIAGFIVAGILVGPKGCGLVNDMHQVQMLSEIGVTLLLFGIGLELPLDRLRRLWKPVLIGGFIQVGLSISITFLIARSIGLSWQASLFTGFIVAVSSTAIVLKGLEQRGEIDAPHGRFTLGILIFQDLCVVPMILIIPFLSNSDGSSAGLISTMTRSVAIIVAVLVTARLIVPKLMDLVARTRQRHLFIMTILLVCIGTAWISAKAGVSLALGAFLAGLIVAGSEYRRQALADIISFREVFISVFFVSVGMLLDLRAVISNIIPIMILLFGIIIGKFLIVFFTGLSMRMPVRVNAMAGAALAQVGEFSFVLMGAAASYQLIDPTHASNLITAAVLSMFLTPFVLSLAPTLAAGVGKIRVLTRLLEVTTAEDAAKHTPELKDHVIIGGYGLAGCDLARALKDCGIPYVIAEMNPENVRKAHQKGEPAFFGDISSPNVLGYLGASRAKEFVIVVNDQAAIEQAVRAASSVGPNLHILVRTRYLQEAQSLVEAGAANVVAAEVETSVEVVANILRRHHVPDDQINNHLSQIRNRKELDVR
ncbi:MAG: cation:proton antiporter [candidate division Zixibacteria bacterium]|nr:cation:proton antiporter [candidate division Zixibacteria bacterium]